jgi:tRNA(adenine34) deaminase
MIFRRKPASTFRDHARAKQPAMSEGAESFMDRALAEARAAGARGEIPVGAVVVCGGAIVAAEGNRTRERSDVTAHAEVLAIRAAAALLGSERLSECDLYVTLEPCTLCAAAIAFARIRRLYYGAADPKGGAVEHGVRFFAAPTCHHAPEVYSGIGETAAAALLRDFFRVLR